MADTDIQIDAWLMERIEKKKSRLDKKRPLPKEALNRLREEIRLVHTYHSNAIEGNTLTLQETKLVIEEGMTIGGKSLSEHLEAKGNAEAFCLIEDLAKKRKKIDHLTVQLIHETVTRGQIRDSGKYRTHNVRIAGADKRPPDFSKILGQMDGLFRQLKSMRTHPVIAAASLHHRLVEIHPFSDGNGRVARLLTSLYLMRHGYPPIVLRKEDRRKYYSCLRMADNNDLAPFAGFIAKAADESLTIYLSVFGGKDELVPLSELARDIPYSQEYMSLRARQGVIDAVKVGNVWHSTKRALETYVEEHGR